MVLQHDLRLALDLAAESGAKTIPDFPARRLASTWVALLPMDEMMPIPVMTTRRMMPPLVS
jgi:hypothetical protein